MCGRFTLRLTPAELQQVFDLFREPKDVSPRYNITPTQSIPVIRGTDAGNELSMMRWGLIPSWSKDIKIGASLINARSETAANKPAFRSAFKRRRCLIPADGFYEWKKSGSKTKQPYHISLRDDGPFAFAGLCETWTSPEGGQLESCTILTTEANSLLKEMHDRMPVILHSDDRAAWIDAEIPSESLEPLLVPYPPEEMQTHAVSTLVNKASHDQPDCLKRVDPEQGTLL